MPASLMWPAEARIEVRGERWTLVSSSSGDACTALHLRPLGDRAGGPRTLIAPFDRPRRMTSTRRCRTASPRRVLHELRRTATRLQPAGTLWFAARTSLRLMPHQIEPPLAMLRGHATRLLIADDVGLGKTIQSGLIAAELAGRSEDVRVLILVPAGLRDQWQGELEAHFGLTAIQADAAWLRASAADRPRDVNPWALPGLYIASHDFVKRAEVLQPLEDVVWDLVVVDEAHAMGPGTDRRAAAHAVAQRARRVVLLTATPPWGDSAALDSLCAIGRIDGSEPPLLMFRRSREAVTASLPRRSVVLPVRLSAVERGMHHELNRYTARVWTESRRRGGDLAILAAIVLRKRALSSAASLARSIRRRIDLLSSGAQATGGQLPLPLSDEDELSDAVSDAALAAPGLPDVRHEQRWLASIALLADEAARRESKTTRLVRLLSRVKEPVLVFTEFRDTLSALERRIASTGLAPLVMHGGLTAPERARAQRAFNAGHSLLLATDAAAEGLNLHQRCRVLIHFELPWSGARLEQRAGRLDRLGQTKRVHEIALVASNTAERLVLAPLVARVAMMRAARPALPRMLTALSESRVAERVLTASPLPVDVPAAPPLPRGASSPPGDLSADARAEVVRLERQRQLTTARDHAHSDRGGRALVAAVPRPSAASNAALILAYAILARGSDGSVVHGEPLVLALDVDLPDAGLIPFVRRVAEAPRGALRDALDRALADAVLRGRQAQTAVERLLADRGQLIARAHGSAARDLVQAGLFDARAIREAARRGAARGALLDALEHARRDADEPLIPEAQLIAVLRAGGKRG